MPRFHDSNGGYGGESRYTPYGGRSNGFHSSSRNSYDDRNGHSNGNDGYRSYNDRDSNRDAPKDEPYHREDISEDELFKTQSNSGINFDKYDNIPVEIFGKDAPAPITSFEEAQLPRVLMENISYAKYTKPTPVQKYSIPVLAMQKRDLMACAQTGSGKTAGFLFPIIARLLSEERQSNRDGRVATPSVLILSPTRELTTQIYDECRKFIYKTGLRTTVVYGGTDARHQINQLGYGSDIVVATPGRLIDLYDRGVIALNKIRYFVLDEADRMLDMGFEPSIRYIVEKSGLPSAEERNTLLFSATFPKEIQRLARDFLNSNYLFLTVGRVGSTTDNITQKFDFVDSFHEKKDLLLKRIEEVSGLCLVFVAKKVDADQIESFLMDNKIKAFAIHGDKTQRQREYALNSLKSGRVQALVATDVAARGLDIPDVNHVINFDLPNNIDDYVHRIGRTGRAGNKGIATAFFSNSNGNIARNLIELLETANQDIPDRLREAASSRGGGFRGGGRFGGGRFGGGRGGGGRFGGGRGGGRGGPRGSYGGNRW